MAGIEPMRTTTILLYAVVCLLSLSIIGAALMTQYVWGEPFYDFIDALVIRGSQLSAGEAAKVNRITRATVRYHGFAFNFGAPLIETIDARVIARHSIQSYRREANTLILYFENGIEFYFDVLPDKRDELLIRIRDSDGQLQANGSTHLSFEYRCPATICAVEQRIVSVRDGDETHYLYLSPGGALDHSRLRVSLRNPVRTLQFSATYTPQLLGELEQQAVGLLAQASLPLEELRAQFIRHAYEDWGEYAYLPADGQWIDREGDARFDEQIMLANLSEALVQDDYTRVFNAMRRAYQQHREQVTIRALPYVGDSFFLVPQFSLMEQQREEKLTALLDSDGIFDDPRLLRYLYFRAPQSTSDAFAMRIDESDYFNLNTDQLLNMLEYLLFDPARNRDLIREIMTSRIVPRIFVINTGLFMKIEEGTIDFSTTLRTAALFQTFARAVNDEQLLRVADALQYSVLQMADDRSYLPQFASLENDRIAVVRGSINPAEVYQYLSDSAHYDTQIALDHERRLWLMSAAAVEVEQVTAEQIRLRITAPQEQGFYIVIGNSDRPRTVMIGGTDYGSDTAFQSRIEGWYWFSDHRFLIIKFHRSSDNNQIVIRYR